MKKEQNLQTAETQALNIPVVSGRLSQQSEIVRQRLHYHFAKVGGGFNLKGIDIKANKRQVLRNLVDPEIGLHFFNRAFEIIDSKKVTQKSLFDAVS